MNTTAIVVDHANSLQNISSMMVHSNAIDLNDNLIITKYNYVAGMRRVSTPLKLLDNNKAILKKHCSPVTLLPSNILATEHMENCIRQEQPFNLP